MRKIVLCLLLIALCVCGAFALSNFNYDYYGTIVYVSTDTNHYVEEYLRAYFNTPSHGIERFIPLRYKDARAKITNVECSDPVKQRTENGFKVLRIGDPDVLINGYKAYDISYNYYTGKDSVKGEDVFYFNLLGTENECRTEHFGFYVVIPLTYTAGDVERSFSAKDVNITLLRGFYGDAGYDHEIEYNASEEDGVLVIAGSASDLKSGEGVTIIVGLPEGFFVAGDRSGRVRFILYVIYAVLIGLAVLSYFKFGVDAPSIVTARFLPPGGLAPMFIGYLADSSVDGKDISSMIFYWADKGYIRIIEEKKNKYKAVKLVSEKEIEFGSVAEMNLFIGLFDNVAGGDELDLHKISPEKLANIVNKCRTQVKGYFTGEREVEDPTSEMMSKLFTAVSALPLLIFSLYHAFFMFQTDRIVFGLYFSVISTIVTSKIFSSIINNWKTKNFQFFKFVGLAIVYLLEVVLLLVFFDDVYIPLMVISIASSIAIMVISKFITKKTKYGREITDEVLGYREFIEKVEMDQLKMLIDQDPDFYYHTLCYAIALGLEKKWADKFKFTTMQTPQWYSGISPIDMILFSRIAGSFTTSINTSVATRNASHTVRTISSHSGGFSGGGFGGGGSRSW